MAASNEGRRQGFDGLRRKPDSVVSLSWFDGGIMPYENGALTQFSKTIDEDSHHIRRAFLLPFSDCMPTAGAHQEVIGLVEFLDIDEFNASTSSRWANADRSRTRW